MGNGWRRPRWARRIGVCIGLLSHAAGAQISDTQEAALLDQHNAFRSEVGLGILPGQPGASNMVRLVWDDALASIAQSWAAQCRFEHNANRGNAGENIALLSGGVTTARLVQGVGLWWEENTGYEFGPFTAADLEFGHYTQVAWAATRAVGCGASFCPTVVNGFPNATLIVCDYAPPGNFLNQSPYRVGETCSACPADRPSCSGGLCGLEAAAAQVPALPRPTLALLGFALVGLALQILRRGAH